MAKQLTAGDFQQSLNDHVAVKGDEIFAKFGPAIGWTGLLKILQDRSVARYPCEVVFDGAPLNAGEFAHPVCNGDQPEAGFKIYVHPLFSLQPDRVPYLVLYQLVAVNYGEFASADDAETFGCHALGIDQEEYYRVLCELADQLDCAC